MSFRLLTTILTVLSLALSVFAARDLTETSTTTIQVPDVLKVPAGYELHTIYSAKGHQYYKFNGTAWVSFSALAKLFKEEKKEVGRHFYLSHPDALGGQPSWETLPSKDVPYSRVTGKAVAHTMVNQKSIAWVLLKATQSEGDKNYLGKVVYIQRYNTCDGLAPSSTSGAHNGTVTKSSYTADYAFYVAKS